MDVEPEQLEREGWTVTTVTSRDKPPRIQAQLVTAEGVRASVTRFDPDASPWATVEVSLPKIANGDNAGLLEWGDVQAAADIMVESASEAARFTFQPAATWRVNRIDAVWAWAAVPGPYLSALALGTLPRCTMARYASGVRWSLPAGGVVARGYDKAKEAGHDVALPLRIERQARPNKHKVCVNGQQVGGPWATFDAQTALGMVRELVVGLGLNRPVLTPQAARVRLVDVHGPRVGENVYRAMLAAREAGGWEGVGGTPGTRRRHRRLAAEAGVTTLYDVEMPPLDVPS